MVVRRVLGPEDGELYEPPGACGDRFLVNGHEWGGGFSLVEHRLPPGVLAAPVHKHTREDEFSFVLEGRLGAVFGGEEVEAGPGDLVFKPRDEWHTFWNAGDTPVRLLEMISPPGLEEMFRWLDRLTEELSPDELASQGLAYGCSVDMAATAALIESHRLTF